MIKTFIVNRPKFNFSQSDFEEFIFMEMKENGVKAEDIITVLRNGEQYEFFYRTKI